MALRLTEQQILQLVAIEALAYGAYVSLCDANSVRILPEAIYSNAAEATLKHAPVMQKPLQTRAEVVEQLYTANRSCCGGGKVL